MRARDVLLGSGFCRVGDLLHAVAQTLDLTGFGIIMTRVSSTQFDFHYGVHNSLQQVYVALERVPVYGGALA